MARNKVQRGRGSASARYITSDKELNALPLGMQVLTLDGILPVEYLCPGDRLITRDSGTACLRAVQTQRKSSPMVRISPGTLGNMRPDHEVILPASQQILLRDWRAQTLFGTERALVPVSRIVDGRFVQAIGTAEVTLIALIFDTPHIVYADGLELASTDLTPAPA